MLSFARRAGTFANSSRFWNTTRYNVQVIQDKPYSRYTSISTTSTSTNTNTTTTTEIPPFPLKIDEIKVEPLSPDEDYRTQRKAVWKLPYYGASDEIINKLSDRAARNALCSYGGLVTKPGDDGNKWRERLRRATRSWHKPKELTIQGTVVSNKMIKSVVVVAKRPAFHSKLQLHYFKVRRFMAHDELNLCREGDEVIIRSCRPLSKRKAHVVVVNYGDKYAVEKENRKIIFRKHDLTDDGNIDDDDDDDDEEGSWVGIGARDLEQKDKP